MGDHPLPSDDHKAPLLPIHDNLSSPPQQQQRSSTAYPFVLSRKNLYILCGPLACLLICLFVDLNGQHTSRNMLAVLSWVFLWWLTEAVPMAVTSMTPLFLFPLFGIASSNDVAKCYMDDIIALVLGSFILALAVEHYNIHRRLALKITTVFCGNPVNPPMLLLGICATTAFVSMWMHNTPCALMMMPVATGILHRFPTGQEDHSQHGKDVTNFCKAVVLGVIYSTAIGGISTLTGTGVNLILVGMWESYYPEAKTISFSTWFFFAFPLALLLFVCQWAILCFMYCSRSSKKTLSSYLDRNQLKTELDSLGPVTFAEKMVLLLFGILVLLWMTKTITNDIPGWGALFHGQVGDGTASVLMATFLFIIPNKRKEGEMLMDWNKCKKLPWSIILLLGAGFAIAEGVRTSGLTDVISSNLDFLTTAPYLAIAPLVCLVSGTITEFTSNNATATLVIPILIEVAKSMSIHPLLLLVPGTIGAQFAFLLPTSTPPNIVGFSTGHFQMNDMIKVGAVLKAASIIVLSLLMPTLGGLVFGTNTPV